MKYIINGIVSIVKLCIVLYAVYYAIESGLVEYVIKLFWYDVWRITRYIWYICMDLLWSNSVKCNNIFN